jgi:hypothetical protein
MFAIVGAVGGAGAAWLWGRGLYRCHYVGEQGVAQFWCAGSRDRLVRTDLFVFTDAVGLRAEQTRTYVAAHESLTNQAIGPKIYAGTTYSYAWFNADGKIIFSLRGKYHAENGEPPAPDHFHLARAAEAAWTNYLLTNIDNLKNERGMIEFALASGDFLSLGDNRLELYIDGKTAVLEGLNVGKVELADGNVTITKTGTQIGWFSTPGLTTFKVADLTNALFFFRASQIMLEL